MNNNTKPKNYMKENNLLGPITEVGVCDDCHLMKNDLTKKLVKRIDDYDNIYLCSSCHIRFKNFVEEDYESQDAY